MALESFLGVLCGLCGKNNFLVAAIGRAKSSVVENDAQGPIREDISENENAAACGANSSNFPRWR